MNKNEFHLCLTVEDEFGVTGIMEYFKFNDIPEDRLKYVVDNVNDFGCVNVYRVDDNNIVTVSFVLREEAANNWNPIKYLNHQSNTDIALFNKNLMKLISEAFKNSNRSESMLNMVLQEV